MTAAAIATTAIVEAATSTRDDFIVDAARAGAHDAAPLAHTSRGRPCRPPLACHNGDCGPVPSPGSPGRRPWGLARGEPPGQEWLLAGGCHRGPTFGAAFFENCGRAQHV